MEGKLSPKINVEDIDVGKYMQFAAGRDFFFCAEDNEKHCSKHFVLHVDSNRYC